MQQSGITKEFIKAAFVDSGHTGVTRVQIKKKEGFTKNPWYAFVQFDSEASAKSALELHGKPIPNCADQNKKFRLNSLSNKSSGQGDGNHAARSNYISY